MTDRAFEPPSEDPFDQADNPAGKPGRFAKYNPDNQEQPKPGRFAKYNPYPDEGIGGTAAAPTETSTTGAFARGVARGAVPAIGSLPAIGAGAEAGAGLGSFVGPWGTLAGGVIGGIAGGLGAGYAISTAQNWALKQLPDSWREKIGMDERQQQLDEGEHPVASFLGGLAPYALTMRPGLATKIPLPENATALQRIMAHPATSRVFGGAAMGGIELGQEAATEGKVEWPKVAISTGFGVVFNRPTRIGETLTEWGAHPARRLMGRPEPLRLVPPATAPEATPEAAPEAVPTAPGAEAVADVSRETLPVTGQDFRTEISERTRTGRPFELPAAEHPPTVADASDTNVMGPGINEAVFMGSHERDPSAVATARETKQTEASLIGPEPPKPDPRAAARRLDPETFEEYDQLRTQEDEARKHIQRLQNPPDEHLAEAEAKRADIEQQLNEHLIERHGYQGGPEARRLKAQLRAAQREHDELAGRRQAFEEGKGVETPELAKARQDLLAVQAKLTDLHPRVQAAYRRAADAHISETVEPHVAPEFVPIVPAEAAAAEKETGTQEGATPAPTSESVVPPGTQAEPRFDLGEPAPGTTMPAPVPPPPEPPKPRTIAEQLAYIAGDVKRALMRVGRPEDEATTAGHLVARRYEARAAHFNGALGTPEELYRQTGAEILGPGARSQQPRIGPARPPRPVNPERMSLLEFADHLGGLQRTGDLAHTLDENFKVRGRNIFRQDGLTEDRFREAASEAGYLVNNQERTGEKASLKELHEAIKEEAKGNKRYRMGMEKPKAIDEEQEAHAREIGEQKEATPEDMSHLSEEDRQALASELFQTKEERKKKFDEMVAEWRGEVAAIRKELEGFDAHPRYEMTDAYDPTQKVLASKNIGGDGAPYRITQFDSRGPWGHFEVRDLDELAKELRTLRRQGFRKAGEPPPPPSELEQSARGSILFRENQRPIMRLMAEQNASTFIHETGHEWLEQLAADAEHEAAPDQLKTDAATVYKWLGIENHADLNTGWPGARGKKARDAHERFATGFEQYLREGVAPSKELAGVFARFKDWLLTIYQTLKGLGKPINEDIRQVFDRMLSTSPERTVIAPDLEMPKSLADHHELDATETHPHEADPVADRIASEAERAYTEHPEEQLELEAEAARIAETAKAEAEGRQPGEGAEPPGEAGPGGAEQAKVRSVGGQPESEPTGGVAGAESGPELRGGTETAGNGAGLSPAERGPGNREGLESVPLAASPASAFPPSGFNIGKDGNVRSENITSVPQFVQAIEESKERIGGGGPITTGQLLDTANALGLEPRDIDEAKLASIFGGIKDLGPKLLALRMAVEKQTQTVHALMDRVRDTGSDAAVAEFAKEAARFDMMMSILSSTTTEWGRAGAAFKNLEGWEKVANLNEHLKANTGRTLYQLKMVAKLGSQYDTPAKVATYLRNAQKRSFGGMVLEYWINGLISGIATHVTYGQGNTLLSFMKAVPETLIAAGVGSVREAMGRPGERVQAGEAWVGAKSMIQGLPHAVQAALEALRTGQPTLLPGMEGRPLRPYFGDTALTVAKSITNDPVTWTEVGAQLFGMLRSGRDGLVAGAALLKAGGEAGAPLVGFQYSPLGQIPDIAIKGVPVVPLGSAIRLPGRSVAAIHSFFSTSNYIREIAAEAYRNASYAKDAAGNPLTGNDFAAHIANGRVNPSVEMMERATKGAYASTLMSEGGAFVKALSQLTNARINLPVIGELAPLKFIDPFVHIGANVINQAIVQRTPIGILSESIRADLSGKNGNVAQDMAAARMLAGTSLALVFGGLAMEDYITGSGPSDPREAMTWRGVYQPHSMRIGDMWYQMNRLGPIGMLISISADMYGVAHHATQGELLTAAAHLQHAITQNILDESFMRGPADLIKAIEDPGRYGENYLRQFASSFVPFSVGLSQIARASDPYSRQARTVMDSIQAKIPGWSQGLYPRIDVWGEPLPSPEAFGHAGFTAVYMKKVNTDPVNKAMLDLGIAPAKMERKIRNVELTEAQYDDFARLAGRMTKMRLDVIVQSPDYQTWPNHIRHDVISEVIRQSREAARGMLMMKNPQIVRDAVEARKAKLSDEMKVIE